MKAFADRIERSIAATKSILCVGLDPVLNKLPKFVLEQESRSKDPVYSTLVQFHKMVLQELVGRVAIVKPNSAFFEAHGISGIKALFDICQISKELGIPLILDAKRGDIGNTAQAYADAYIGKIPICSAVTINPFLGFDTLDPFVKSAKDNDCGLFVLVKTSNPGSSDIQGVIGRESNCSISDTIAYWLSKNNESLIGSNGLSGLGAVIGATYPEEAKALRKIMRNNIFLIPGVGAQGGSAKDAMAGCIPNQSTEKSGLLINVSRGILGDLTAIDENSLKLEIRGRVEKFNKEIATGL